MEYFSKDLFLLFSIEDVRIEFLTYRGRKDLEGGGRFACNWVNAGSRRGFIYDPSDWGQFGSLATQPAKQARGATRFSSRSCYSEPASPPSLFGKIKAFRWILVITYYFDFEIRSEAHLLEIKRDEFSSLEEIKEAAFFFSGKLKLGS